MEKKASFELSSDFKVSDKIILKSIRKVREGWDEAFKKMKIASDDKLFIDDSLTLVK